MGEDGKYIDDEDSVADAVDAPDSAPVESAPAREASGSSEPDPAAEPSEPSEPSEPPEPPEPIQASVRRRRRWPLWLLGVAVILIAAATFVAVRAPGFVEERLRSRLAESWGASVEVDQVEIDWTTLTVHVVGLRFDDGERVEVDIERLEAHLSWRDILGGSPLPAIVIYRPHVSFQAGRESTRPPSQRGFDQFESLAIFDGSVEVMLDTTRGPAFVDLTEIEAHMEYRTEAAPSAQLDLGVSIVARVGEAGRLEANGRTSSRDPADGWSFRFELRDFELASLNLVWLDLIEMDVDRGVLSLDGDLTRSPSRLRGRIRPHFENVALLGASENALHPVAEALFGHMLMGARSTLPIDRPMTADRGSSLPELLETDWQTIIRDVIQRGYARRLNKLRGFQARIGDVGVDFSQGLLQLFDVVIDAEDPLLDIPLVQIDRVDVVFDPAVAVPGATAYKHVTLWRPTLTFATGVDESNNRLQFDESWIDTISAIPFATRDLVVHQGRLDVWDLRNDEPLNVYVADIELEGREMARDLHPAGVRGAQMRGTGTILGESKAAINLVYEPRATVPNVDLHMRIEPIALTTLAPALQTYAQVDAIGGSVGLSAHLDARDYGVEASVVPEVHRPRLRAMGNRRLRKLVLERALRHLKSHVIQLRYEAGPNEGVLHEFFPALIKSVFLDR